jgi:hypothetical protein
MSLFKRHDQGGVQVSEAPSPRPGAEAGQAQQQARSSKLTPPFVSPVAASQPAAAPGVVPPPAAPIYSMRPPEPEAPTAVAEKPRAPKDAQQSIQASVNGSVNGSVQVAVRRTRAASAASSLRSRPVQQPAASTPAARLPFDAVRAAQTGLLNLAWSWQAAGAPIRAIHTYMQVLHRYPDTPAADAAVADLVELSQKLAGEGQFHTALAIYEHLEQLA